MILAQYKEDVLVGKVLSSADIQAVVEDLMASEVPAELKKDFLSAWHQRGERPEEVAALAEVFRGLAARPDLGDGAQQAIDVCGTGGDGSNTFNISTVVSFVLASAGVPVLKHGNRSITSKSGSADFLEFLGLSLACTGDAVKASLEALSWVFFFAPAYHPAFKEIMPVRRALASEGQRSVFNILGPLINPGQPPYQVLGVFDEMWVQPLAESLHHLGLRRGFVVTSLLGEGRFVDELTCVGENVLVGFGEFSGQEYRWRAADLGLTEGVLSDLAGGDVQANGAILEDLFADKAPLPLRDSIVLNAGVALWVQGQTSDVQEGLLQAKELLLGGQTKAWLARAQSFYQSL